MRYVVCSVLALAMLWSMQHRIAMDRKEGPGLVGAYGEYSAFSAAVRAGGGEEAGENMNRCVFDDWSISVAEQTGYFVVEDATGSWRDRQVSGRTGNDATVAAFVHAVGADLGAEVHRLVASRTVSSKSTGADERSGKAGDDRLPVLTSRPNPFASSTQIAFTLPGSGHATVRVFDGSGLEVAVLTDDYREEGTYLVTFDGSGLESGTYTCVLEAGPERVARQLVLEK